MINNSTTEIAAIASEDVTQFKKEKGYGPPKFLLWIWLLAPIVVLLLASFLQASEGRLIQLRGTSMPLPEICAFQRTTTVDCPGCGLTRSFIALSKGDLRLAWTLNMASPFVFAFVLLQIPLATLRLVQPSFVWNQRFAHFNLIAMLFVVTLIFAQWAYRLLSGDLV